MFEKVVLAIGAFATGIGKSLYPFYFLELEEETTEASI